MIRYIRNNIITIREAIGLDIHFMDEGNLVISGVHLKAQKGKVVKVKAIERIANFKDLQLPKNIPVAVTLNGKGILMRTNKGKATENLVSSWFPGVNPQDFVYTLHDMEGEDNMAYIARRTFVEDVIKEVNEAGIRIVSLTLGTNPLNMVLSFMYRGPIELSTPTLKLDINDKKIISVQQERYPHAVYKEIEIGEMHYNTNQVLALGSALSLLSVPADRVHSDIKTSEISYLQKDYVYYKLFQFTGWAVLITLLTLLLVNFFVFNHYYTKNNELVQSNSLIDAQLNNSLEDNAQVDSSYNFFMRSGWNRITKHGYFADRIAALVPPTVSLTGLQAAPLQESVGMNDYIFSQDKIWVSGTSADPTELETFSRALKNINGVQGVAIKNYVYKAEIGAATFLIEITTGS
ncbi:hypothetical protein [Niabella hibiscisoli]|uniref:hypothetical protein n=1 Tax=Niabella hibiscisoli TaxID=1825928 RepID=UPI001F0FFE55|nr:hypothetical protein [Niabella hibiscisoli]MCH5718221.1 hypothetical protein [Niabella hibiscisoli]